MSGKSQTSPEEEQADLLEQIFTQGLEKLKAPTQATAAEETLAGETDPIPGPAESDGNAPPPEKKNKRSAVCFYLMILFGAAFLITLLACFAQRRGSENTIDSMSLSPEEFMAEIRKLEEKNAALEAQNTALENLNNEQVEWIGRLNGNLAQWQERYEEKVQEADNLREQYYAARTSSNAWQTFWMLEQSYQSGDYESCAALLLLIAQRKYAYYSAPQTASVTYM